MHEDPLNRKRIKHGEPKEIGNEDLPGHIGVPCLMLIRIPAPPSPDAIQPHRLEPGLH
jgi:hypothetical protein